MPVEGLTQAASVKVGGRPISQAMFDRLAEARVELSVGAAGWFQMRLASDEPLEPAWAIGAAIQISFDDDEGDVVPVFVGTIDSLAIDYDRNHRQLVVSGYDERRKLGSEPVVRAFTNRSYSDIVKELAQEASLTAEVHSEADHPKFDHILQVGSNTEFMFQIANRLGMDWSVVDGELVIGPRGADDTVELEFGEQLRRFQARYTSIEHPATVEVHGWDPKSKEPVRAAQTAPQNSPASTVPIESRSRSSSANGRTATAWRQPLASQAHGEAVAKGYARRMASGDLTGRGETTGNPAIVPGVQCEISGIDEDWNGSYFVTSAEHVYRRDDPYLTRFTVGAYDSSSLVDLMGSGPHRGGVGFGSGITIGIVTNNAKSGGDDGDDFGHVKVKFPYLDEGVESAWARVATIGAGKDRGIMFVPEVDDEVLVAFEHGDVTRPYVIGTLWNGVDTPPLTRSGDDLDKRTVVSRLGHKLTFFDGSSDDKKNVTIELADGATKVHVGHDKIEVIANDGKPIEVKNDKARVVLTGSGDIQLEGENVSIKAKQKLKLDGQAIETSSQADTKVTAGAKFEATANAPSKVQSSAVLELKGAMVKVN